MSAPEETKDTLPTPKAPVRNRPAWSVRGPMMLGGLAVLVLVGGVGGWATTAQLAGAIIAEGQIEVDRNRQPLQHPQGGLVSELGVREGDAVDANDLILRFDSSELQTQRAVTRARLAEIRARRARLEAEQSGTDAVVFPEALVAEAAADADIADLIEGQRNLFAARAASLESEVLQLNRRMTQIEAQIEGLAAQEQALEEQLVIVEEDLARQQDALDRGVGLSGPVLQLQREAARLRGQIAEIRAGRAEAGERLVEIELSILQRSVARREEAIAELREIRVSEQELTERLAGLDTTLAQLDVRAPVAGTVFGLTVFGDQAVVRAAEPFGYLVPEGRPLVITAQVEAVDIDEVVLGQGATLRFPAFPLRDAPELTGSVTLVSADAFADDRTGASYYRIEIVIDEGQSEALGNRQLLPGMPVQAFIRTSDRTTLEYLIEPLADYFNRAFRES